MNDRKKYKGAIEEMLKKATEFDSEKHPLHKILKKDEEDPKEPEVKVIEIGVHSMKPTKSLKELLDKIKKDK